MHHVLDLLNLILKVNYIYFLIDHLLALVNINLSRNLLLDHLPVIIKLDLDHNYLLLLDRINQCAQLFLEDDFSGQLSLDFRFPLRDLFNALIMLMHLVLQRFDIRKANHLLCQPMMLSLSRLV